MWDEVRAPPGAQHSAPLRAITARLGGCLVGGVPCGMCIDAPVPIDQAQPVGVHLAVTANALLNLKLHVAGLRGRNDPMCIVAPRLDRIENEFLGDAM